MEHIAKAASRRKNPRLINIDTAPRDLAKTLRRELGALGFAHFRRAIRTVINIEKAAKLTMSEEAKGLRIRKYREYPDNSPRSPEDDLPVAEVA